ncbi:MAG TPA: fused MFS/spermidine synthase [Opitutaceae bacterium]
MIIAAFHFFVVVLGILSMGFQLLGSRLLNPHFGSSIIVWAWLISTFLAAFSTGSILGGWISSLPVERRGRTQVIVTIIGVLALAFTSFLGRSALGWIELQFENISVGLLVACFGLFFVPVAVFSSFGPQCVQFLASRGTAPGSASGLVYGISTVGNIAGVMITAFLLIPNLPVSTLLQLWLSVAIFSSACLILILRLPPEAPNAP